MIQAILQTALVLLVYMFGFYLLALWKNNNGFADTAWGLGFCLVAVYNLLIFGPRQPLVLLVNGLVFIWGFRLVIHIFTRNWGKPEDSRYQNFRKKWGSYAWLRSFTDVFLLQGVLLLLIAMPIIYVNFTDPSFTFLAYIGLLIWLMGFFFEAVGDYQLAQFVKTKKPGQIMQTGLWRYTRHPNYFGEVTMWWGIFFMVIDSWSSWYLIISPLLITYLILFLSGIPMLEKKYEGNSEFDAYKKKTSAFWPLKPKV